MAVVSIPPDLLSCCDARADIATRPRDLGCGGHPGSGRCAAIACAQRCRLPRDRCRDRPSLPRVHPGRSVRLWPCRTRPYPAAVHHWARVVGVAHNPAGTARAPGRRRAGSGNDCDHRRRGPHRGGHAAAGRLLRGAGSALLHGHRAQDLHRSWGAGLIPRPCRHGHPAVSGHQRSAPHAVSSRPGRGR